MTPEERDLWFVRYLAAFPTGPRISDETIIVWNEHLTPMDRDAAFGALRYLERNAKRKPGLAEIIEAYEAQPRHHKSNEVGPPVCGLCEDGWLIVRCEECNCGPRFIDDGRCPAKSTQNVARCPNGCKPMNADQRAARDRRDDDQHKQARRREREAELDLRIDRLADVVDPSEPRQSDAF